MRCMFGSMVFDTELETKADTEKLLAMPVILRHFIEYIYRKNLQNFLKRKAS